MSARQANEQEQLLMGWPLGWQKQAEIGAALQKAAETNASTVVGCWCAETGFALLVEIFEGKPIHWHCTGPCNVDQARRWFKGMERANDSDPVSFNA